MRKAGNEIEYYYWAVMYPDPSLRENDKILLSNDNLFDPIKLMTFKTSNTQTNQLPKL
jgi:hypothetical protein